jgi:tetratricopeptide (TPR) repeat protein
MSPRSRRLAPLTVATALLLLACGSAPEVESIGTRAVLIGIDGADWKLIEEIAAAGGMPNRMGLRERGTWGPIETLADIPLSPVIWTSVATGKTAAKHGISWFMVDRPDGTRVPVRSHNREVEAIWNILAAGRRRAAVVGWWATYPAEDVGQGVIVTDGLGYHGFGSTARGGEPAQMVHPGSRFAELDALVAPPQQVSWDFASRFIHLGAEEYRAEMFDPARFPEPDPFNPIHLFQQYAVTAQGYTAIGERLLEEDFDLVMLYFEQVDSFSHLFMKYDPPKLEWVDQEPFERYRDIVREWYRYQDELLGRLLAHIDLEQRAVFVVSDHGFKSGERRIRSEETVDVKRAHLDHETHGIFVAAGPHIRSGHELAGASVMDVAPTLLHYLGFPVGKDMDGRVLETLFEPELLESHPIRYVPTWERGRREGGEAARGRPAGDDDAQATAANVRALEALGYLGGAEEGTRSAAAAPGGASSPEIHNNLGRIHLRNGALDQAETEFRKALSLDPADSDALLNLASIERLRGRTTEAERLIERALQVDPSSIGALSQLAELERDRGDLDEAIRLFEEALALDDALPFLHLGYGDVLQRAGRFDEAEAAFRLVLQLDPDSFKARYNLGVTHGNQGRLDDAVAEYERALEVDPDNPEAPLVHNNLGAIALDRGDVDSARDHFERAVKAAPGHLESRYNLALVDLEAGRLDEAIALLEGAVATAPNHELVNVRLGLAYLEAGRGDDAFRTFTLVRRLYPENWVALLGLAVLHAANGRPDEARPLLATALELGGAQALETARGYPVLADLL